jgi:hypothetical protein
MVLVKFGKIWEARGKIPMGGRVSLETVVKASWMASISVVMIIIKARRMIIIKAVVQDWIRKVHLVESVAGHGNLKINLRWVAKARIKVAIGEIISKFDRAEFSSVIMVTIKVLSSRLILR